MINIEDIEKVAGLARLELSSAEKTQFTKQLEQVISHFKELERVDTAQVVPLITPVEIEEFWREDNCKSEMTVDEALSNAPEKAGRLFKVPPVV